MKRRLLAVSLLVLALLLLAAMPVRTRAICDGSAGCEVQGSTSLGGFIDWPAGTETWRAVFPVLSLILIVAGTVLLIRSVRRRRRPVEPESSTRD